MATLTETKARPQRKPLPPPNSDFYQLAETLAPEELAVVKQVRAFMESKVAPIATKYWADDAFPFELLPAFKELNLGGVGMQGYGCRGGSALLFGLVAMEMSRVDSRHLRARSRIISDVVMEHDKSILTIQLNRPAKKSRP